MCAHREGVTNPAPELPDMVVPDGLLVVHGELIASSAWEIVDASEALGTEDADRILGGSRTPRTIGP